MYPVVLRLAGKRCLVVGGGRVALRKVEGLLASGATVTVVAPEVDAALRALATSTGRVEVLARPYEVGDLEGMWLVIAATNDPAVQQAVFDDGQRAHVWVNAADDPERCAFYLPAVHRRSPILVAVSTEGTSPALASWLRDRLADQLPERLEDLARALADERAQLQRAGRSTEGRDWAARIEELLAGLESTASPAKVAKLD